MKRALYLLEYLILNIIFFIFKLIPINYVSVIGCKFFQIIGPFSKSHNTAFLNLKKVFPSWSEKKISKNLSKSWNNLGKTLSELIILNKLLNNENKRIKILGIENLKKIKNNNKPVIFFSIHQANWELLVPTLDNLGIKVGAIYRHINNPYINALIIKIRSKTLNNKETFYTPKGKESAKEILLALNKGQSFILLIDQKDSAGKNVKLFNHSVKTQTGFLKIAKKNNLELIPVQNIREKINNFKIIFHPPMNPFKANLDEISAMSEIHKIIEKWIKEKPDQWLWQHKRFD